MEDADDPRGDAASKMVTRRPPGRQRPRGDAASFAAWQCPLRVMLLVL